MNAPTPVSLAQLGGSLMDFTIADALAYLRTDQSDLHDRLCADIIEEQAREIERLDGLVSDLHKIASDNMQAVSADRASHERDQLREWLKANGPGGWKSGDAP